MVKEICVPDHHAILLKLKKKENRLRKTLISLEELCCWALSKASHFLMIKKKEGKILLSKSKEGGKIKIYKEKELKKHLSIANKRRITGDNEKQL